ncbi:MAG TPA: lamin tail domain-containing protein, partial [Anaerolineae bacterium]
MRTTNLLKVRLPLFVSLSGLLALVLLVGSLPIPAQAASPNVVISQIYGGGGNSGATYKNDFVELFNRGTTPVSVTGWSVQYASASGSAWQATALVGSIAPGQYYLVQEAAGTGGTVNLPTPDATGAIPMSATGGKIALVNTSTPLTGSGCPFGASIVDFIGYDGANCSETSPAATLSNSAAAFRDRNGCVDTDNNVVDFAAGAPSPRNTASPLANCSLPPSPQVHIHDIQGASHISPLNTAAVFHVPGIVTA